MARVMRVNQQDDGEGLVIRVKCKKHQLQNILDANRELENLNEIEGGC